MIEHYYLVYTGTYLFYHFFLTVTVTSSRFFFDNFLQSPIVILTVVLKMFKGVSCWKKNFTKIVSVKP